jgi:hypothetical protein
MSDTVKSGLNSEFSGVRKFSADRLHDQSSSNCARARQNANWLSIDQRLHALQIRLEFTLGNAGRLDADSTEILRLTATGNSVSSSSSSSSKKANAWHIGSLRGVEKTTQTKQEMQARNANLSVY